MLVLVLGLSCQPAPVPVKSQPEILVQRSMPFARLPPDEALFCHSAAQCVATR
jgi:hypothetical protein